MAKERLSMRKIKEVLRLKFENKLSENQISLSCHVSRSTVKEYLDRTWKAGLSWPFAPDLDDASLENMLFPPAVQINQEKRHYPPLEEIHRELKRKNVTLHLLWEEYREGSPDGYAYSQFCDIYRRWLEKIDVCMRQPHRAGEKLFVDYAGQTIPIINSLTGESMDAYLFVAVLGASNYTYAEATLTQDIASWITSHVRTFSFLDGVTEILVPDNLKAGVTHPCRYEPDINKTYLDMAQHYGTVVIPARVRKPKDKAKVEAGVLIVERQIIAALRNHTFFDLAELNRAIREKLADLNSRPLQLMKVSRRELFETIDKPAMKALPERPYEYAEWKKATVNIDYHIAIGGAFYSVPYSLAKEQVEARITTSTVEILFKGKRVASHPRDNRQGAFNTLPEHMPEAHKRYLEWTPSRIVKWAAKNGPQTEALVTAILESKKHPEQGYRSCLGIIRLGNLYPPERLEAACARALMIKGYSYKNVASILKNKLDQSSVLMDTLKPATSEKPIQHPNIRGKDYYHDQEVHHA